MFEKTVYKWRYQIDFYRNLKKTNDYILAKLDITFMVFIALYIITFGLFTNF